jgi:type I restriction enzyme S subunit
MRNNKQKALVPELRFPEFKDCGNWRLKEVTDIFEISRGHVLSMGLVEEKPSYHSIYPVYSSQTKNDGLAGYYKDFLYENAITWTTDGANAGDVNYRTGKFYCTNVCGVLLSDEGYANLCIAELLQTVTKKYVSYVGNPKLMNGVMGKIQIPFPNIEQQQKIADCLSSIDKLITAQIEKLATLKTHKKGLMQQLFPAEGKTLPKLRFSGFQNVSVWKKKPLCKVSQIIMGSSPKSVSYNESGIGLPLLQGNADIKNRLSAPKIYTSQVTKVCGIGDILLSVRAPVGTVAKSIHKACIGRGISAIKTFADSSQEYLYQWLLFFELHWHKVSQGGIFSAVNSGAIKGLLVPIPNKKEQQKIADCLSSLDELITAQTQKIDALKAHKKGLMQKLFPSMDRVEI